MTLGGIRYRRQTVLFLSLLLLIPSIILYFFSTPDSSDEQLLISALGEFQERLNHFESINLRKHEDFHLLAQQLHHILMKSSETNNGSSFLQLYELEEMFALNRMTNYSGIRLPSMFTYLPHLLKTPRSLWPAIKVSRDKQNVSIVMGIPTVKRESQSYLLSTLDNLIEGLDKKEKEEALIVVFIGESDSEYANSVMRQIEKKFPESINDGLLEVISPYPEFYPNFDELGQTLGDSLERVKWRTKQNLDFSFLMMYCQTRGMFYIQLEDDILARKGYITTIKKFITQKTSERKSWFILDFCQLGFIGKLFRTSDLPRLINFLLMFQADKPSDWLLDHMVQNKVCRFDMSAKHCKAEKEKLWLHLKPSLFQHVGTHSSLKGKVQKLKDKQFGRVQLYFPHANPPASVSSNIKHYKQYSIKRLYEGQSFFWGLLPQSGDVILFAFNEPHHVKRFLFRSGNIEHPSDKFYNTTVEVLPHIKPSNVSGGKDNFIVVGSFDESGIAEGEIDVKLGAVDQMRLFVHSESENWAILSEVLVEVDDKH